MPSRESHEPSAPVLSPSDPLGSILHQFAELQARFDDLQAQLTQCHRLSTLGTLTSIIAHEYNNILTPIISYAQLALASPDDRGLLIKAAERALAGAERAAKLSASILGFAREDDGGAAASVRQVVEESIACLGRDLGKDGITLHVAVPEVTAAISPLSLQQVLVNLILNARQAMIRPSHRGRRDLHIQGRSEGDRLHLIVRDTGPGLPPHLRENLFEPFVTHTPASDAQTKGTGLGLAICRDLIHRAGGSITLDEASPPSSDQPRGATFHIEIPLAGRGSLSA